MLFLNELISAAWTGDFKLAFSSWGAQAPTALRTREYLMLECFFNSFGIQSCYELAVDLEGGNAHDMLLHQCLSCISIRGDVSFLIGDMLF